MKKYTHIFFDLDRTLWDYDVNATETLHDLIERYQIINGYPVDKETFVKEFFSVNKDLWNRFDQGLIDKRYIRYKRFPMVLENLQIDGFDNVGNLQDDFINECPTKGNLINGAEHIVKQLSEIYPLTIITNGFDDIQGKKLKYSGLERYFNEIITSERANAPKPDPKIFDFAMNIAKAQKSSSVMVGDNFESDILGARISGMDQVHFNPEKRINRFDPTYEIHHLDQLTDILL